MAVPANHSILNEYRAKGFPGAFDKAIATVRVAKIDRVQAHTMIRLCAETETVLYGHSFSPRRIRYCSGRRPGLEIIASSLHVDSPLERARMAMRWVEQNVQHPHLIGELPPDRGFHEEELIRSGMGYCNEQSRVFIALCEVMELPARLCFLFHDNLRCAHTATEVLLNGRWTLFDVTFGVIVELPNGRLAEARELKGDFRHFANEAYRRPLTAYYEKVLPYVENVPGWNHADRPKIDAGGDLFGQIGICNYIIDGVEVF